jgi:hypothetical protein
VVEDQDVAENLDAVGHGLKLGVSQEH